MIEWNIYIYIYIYIYVYVYIYLYLSYKNQDRISYICKGNKIFIHVDCQTKTVSSMVTKETSIRPKVGKTCNNMLKLNQNWSLKL